MFRNKNALLKILSLVTILSIFSSFTAFGSTNNMQEPDFISTAALTQPDISAKTGILMDGKTGKILYEKDAHQKLAPASVTKIMTMLLVMEAVDSGKISMADKVGCSELANSMGGTQIWLEVNEQMTVEELLKATAVASANDAAMALGEFVGGSAEGFVAMMNNKAVELGMNDTNFVNPTGLDADGHLTSAHDIALMSKELMKHKDIQKFTTIWMDSLRGGKTELVNTNKLIRFYKGATGLKTGTTDKAGSCVSVTASRDNMELIAVVMGCQTSKDRFDSARKLLDFGFGNFSMYKTVISKEILKPVKVLNGVTNNVEVTSDEASEIIIPKGLENRISEDVSIISDVIAPVEVGQILGEVKLTLDEEVVAVYQIKAAHAVERMTLYNAFKILFERFICI